MPRACPPAEASPSRRSRSPTSSPSSIASLGRRTRRPSAAGPTTAGPRAASSDRSAYNVYVSEVGRTLVVLGVVLIVVGLLTNLGGRLPLGRLPGDIVYRKGSFTFYF